jgi:hypothetical protein
LRFIVWSSLQGQTPVHPGSAQGGNVNGYPALAAFTHFQEDRGYILKTFWFANPRNKGWRAHSFAAAEIRGNVVDHMLKVHAA